MHCALRPVGLRARPASAGRLAAIAATTALSIGYPYPSTANAPGTSTELAELTMQVGDSNPQLRFIGGGMV